MRNAAHTPHSHRARGKRSRGTRLRYRGKASVLATLVGLGVVAITVLTWAVHDLTASPKAAAPLPSASAVASTHASATASAVPRTRASATPTVDGHADPLGTAVSAYLATRAGTVMVTVDDLATAQNWSVGSVRPQAAASVVKLDILETLLAEHRASGTALRPSEMSLARSMIEDSDNNAATSLWDDVGGPRRIAEFNASVGLTDTTPSQCVTCAGFPWPGWGLTTTTTPDQVSLLRQIVQPGDLLGDADRAYALQLLESVTPDQRWGVSGGVPAGVTVALKDGWLPMDSSGSDWQINSVGWICGDGRNYLIAVLTTGNPTEQYGIDTIDQLSAMVWSQMQ
jgi:Beta-lactamase enzyme family